MRSGKPRGVRIVPVRHWVMCGTIVTLFAFIAFMVWGLGRTLQSLFN